jgi:hypothetical protein
VQVEEVRSIQKELTEMRKELEEPRSLKGTALGHFSQVKVQSCRIEIDDNHDEDDFDSEQPQPAVTRGKRPGVQKKATAGPQR